MDDRLSFVQFLHPGGEHQPNHPDGRGWTVGPHGRKFLIQPGRLRIGDDLQEKELVFWGEWEAESDAAVQITSPLLDGPRWIYRPYYNQPSHASLAGLQNTDPFVYGDQFHYTGCLQHTVHGPTQMRHLARGSVVLFGSCLRRSAFVVDTVFVVDSFVDHHQGNYEKQLLGRISETYNTVTIAPWYADPLQGDHTYRLYFGATIDQPVEGMFSYVPCLPAELAAQGFARPVVTLPGAITPSQTQNRKHSYPANLVEMKHLWDRVTSQVADHGLALGVSISLPPCRKEQPPEAQSTPRRRTPRC